MKHWFVTGDNNLKARWVKAFGEAATQTPSLAIEVLQPDDIVWLPTSSQRWQEDVMAAVGCQAKVVVLSYTPNDREALLALDLGARGYSHTLSAPELLKQVALVVSHQGVWVGQDLLMKVLGGSFRALQVTGNVGHDAVADCLDVLTARERSVAAAVASGASNKEVARQLEITERTVKAHLSAIFKKLEVRDRLQLILKLSANHVVS